MVCCEILVEWASLDRRYEVLKMLSSLALVIYLIVHGASFEYPVIWLTVTDRASLPALLLAFLMAFCRSCSFVCKSIYFHLKIFVNSFHLHVPNIDFRSHLPHCLSPSSSENLPSQAITLSPTYNHITTHCRDWHRKPSRTTGTTMSPLPPP